MANELVIQVLVLVVLITLWAQAVVQIRLMNERQKGRQDVFSGLGSLLHGNTQSAQPQNESRNSPLREVPKILVYLFLLVILFSLLPSDFLRLIA